MKKIIFIYEFKNILYFSMVENIFKSTISTVGGIMFWAKTIRPVLKLKSIKKRDGPHCVHFFGSRQCIQTYTAIFWTSQKIPSHGPNEISPFHYSRHRSRLGKGRKAQIIEYFLSINKKGFKHRTYTILFKNFTTGLPAIA